MKLDSIKLKAITYTLTVLIVLYFIIQMTGIFDSTPEIEYAVQVSVNDSIQTEGLFIRDEFVVDGKTSGAVVLAVDSGEKVSKSQTIAVYYDSAAQADISRQIENIDSQIEDYKYVIRQAVDKPDASKLDSEIIKLTQSIDDASSHGIVNSLLTAEAKSKIIRRSLIYGDISNIQLKLSELQSKHQNLQSQLSGHVTSIAAEQSGYFITELDGFEDRIDTARLSTLTTDEIRSLRKSEAQFSEYALGKISKNFEWYFAAIVSQEQASRIQKRLTQVSKIRLRFPNVLSDVSVSLYDSKQQTDGSVLMIFMGTNVTDKLLKLRFTSAEIILKTYEGIKIPKTALRQVDGSWGVYCMSGQRIIFKKVAITYETETYFITESDGLSSKEVFIYDEIVVGGKGINGNQIID